MGSSIISLDNVRPTTRIVTIAAPETAGNASTTETTAPSVTLYKAGGTPQQVETADVMRASQRRFYTANPDGVLIQSFAWSQAPAQLQSQIEQAVVGAQDMFNMEITPLLVTTKNGITTITVNGQHSVSKANTLGTITIDNNTVSLSLPKTYDDKGLVYNNDLEFTYSI